MKGRLSRRASPEAPPAPPYRGVRPHTDQDFDLIRSQKSRSLVHWPKGRGTGASLWVNRGVGGMNYQFPGKDETGLIAPENTDIRALVQAYEQDEDFDPYHFKPAGTISRSFIAGKEMSRFIMGPVGGGKTVSCVFARIVAATQMPPCKDGWIRDRFVVVRTSFRDAERTVLNSWKQWFPRTYPGSSWSGGNDRPATHILRWRLPNGLKVEAETIFLGIGDQSIEDILRGLEISGGWMNEADTLAANVLRYIEQRTGRYPKKEDLADQTAKRMRTVLGDYNAPDMDNWTYEQLVENPAPPQKTVPPALRTFSQCREPVAP